MLQLEAGNFYRTRDGHRAYVAGCSPFQHPGSDRAWSGYIEGRKGDSVILWRDDGGYYGGTGWVQTLDLVAEWVDPPVERWVVEWETQSTTVYHEEHEARRAAERHGGVRVFKVREVIDE